MHSIDGTILANIKADREAEAANLERFEMWVLDQIGTNDDDGRDLLKYLRERRGAVNGEFR